MGFATFVMSGRHVAEYFTHDLHHEGALGLCLKLPRALTAHEIFRNMPSKENCQGNS